MAQYMSLPLEKIRTDGGTQMRGKGVDEERIVRYAEAHRAWVAAGRQGKPPLPPGKTMYDGLSYWLWDGHQTKLALELAGERHMEVEVSPGTQRDAVMLACGANLHGLDRDEAYRKKAVLTLLRDAEWSKLPDGEVAARCGGLPGGVSRDFVQRLRQKVAQAAAEKAQKQGESASSAVAQDSSVDEEEGDGQPAAAPTTRLVTRNGVTYEMALPRPPKLTAQERHAEYLCGRAEKLAEWTHKRVESPVKSILCLGAYQNAIRRELGLPKKK